MAALDTSAILAAIASARTQIALIETAANAYGNDAKMFHFRTEIGRSRDSLNAMSRYVTSQQQDFS